MATEEQKLKPIWYFVGLVLLSMGTVVLVSGLLTLFSGSLPPTALARLHPAVWWGGIMVTAGGVFVSVNRKKRIE